MSDKTDPEFDIWQAYTKTVKPLSGSVNPLEQHHIRTEFKSIKKSAPKTKKLPLNMIPPTVIPKSDEAHICDFYPEKNIKKRMRKGKFTYNAKIDLHGMTQNQAYDNLKSFITGHYYNKNRHLLVITGRGRFCYKTHQALGVLIRKVPEWLREKPFNHMVSVIESASRYDGSEGALYVILKHYTK